MTPVLTLLAEAGHGPSLKIEGFYLINFIVFVGGLVFLLRRPIHEFVVARRRRIVAEIEEARRLREEAERKLADYEGRLARLEEEMTRILDEAKAAGEEERKRILLEATKAAARIREDAKARLEQEARKIQRELEVQAVEMSIEVAEKLVKERLTDTHRKAFVADYITEIERTSI